ncbi:MAG TPA: hypothetical protein VJW76_00430, partial [Verrucomicrobiae bacterium]|nr:hypothetical protein [Verrucomicrobiae bacterium]
PEPRTGWFLAFWPKLVWALPVLVVTAIAAALLMPALSRTKSKAGRTLELARQNDVKPFGEVPHEDLLAKDKNKLAETPALREPTEPASTSTGIPATPPPAAAPLASNEKETASAQTRTKEADLAKSVKETGTAVRSEALAYAEAVKQQPTPPSQTAPATRGSTTAEEPSVLLRQQYGLTPAEKVEARGDTRSRARDLGAARAPGNLSSGESQLALNQLARNGGTGGAAAPDGAKRNDDAPGTRGAVAAEGVKLALKAPEGRAAPGNVPAGVQLGDERAASTDRFASFSVPATGQTTQRFEQVRNYRVNLNSPALEVLGSFQLEQNGRAVRIVDSDGSTYEGQTDDPQVGAGRKVDVSVTAAAVEESKKAADSERVRTPSELAASDALGLTSQYFGFRVTGTNRTLNKLVVFQGNLLAGTNAMNANGVAGGISPAQQAAVQVGQMFSFPDAVQMQGARIQGQATIGGSNRMEINAVPVSP